MQDLGSRVDRDPAGQIRRLKEVQGNKESLFLVTVAGVV